NTVSFLIESLLGSDEASRMAFEPVGVMREPAQRGDDCLGRLVQHLDSKIHVGASLPEDPCVAVIAVIALIVITKADGAELAQRAYIGGDLVGVIEALGLRFLGPSLEWDRTLSAEDLHAGKRELSLAELSGITVVKRFDFGQLQCARCRDEPNRFFRLI